MSTESVSRGPVNPYGSTLPDGRWYPSIGGPAMCDGERVWVIDLPPDETDPYRRDALIAWPRGMDERVRMDLMSPVPEFGRVSGDVDAAPESIRSITVTIEVDTNKRTERRVVECESIDDIPADVAAAVDELNETFL